MEDGAPADNPDGLMVNMPPKAEPLLRWRVMLAYADSDAAGILYFAAWFSWMERMSTQAWLDRGFRHDQMLERIGVQFVTRATTCDYVAVARPYDEIDIEMELTEAGRRSLRFAFTMTRAADTTVVARATFTLVCVDGSGRSAAIPPDVRTAFESSQCGT
jgi:acyl-CoA thioester hydrolase